MKRLFALLLLGLFLAGCKTPEMDVKECSQDADCVPASCCHASSCIASENKPDCSGIYCSMECAPGTLDCGQGSCVCKEGKCGASFN